MPKVGIVCPGSYYGPERHATTGAPVLCDPRSPTTPCSIGNQCVRSSIGLSICCQTPLKQRDAKSPPECFSGQPPLADGAGRPVHCTGFGMVHSGCPREFSCQPSTSEGLRICCPNGESSKLRNPKSKSHQARSPKELYCPVGFSPNIIGPAVQECSAGPISAHTQCALPFQCLDSPNGSGKLCCQVADNFLNPCQMNQIPLQIDGIPQYCTDIGLPCQRAGFTCQKSINQIQNICCKEPGLSVAGSMPLHSQTFRCPQGAEIFEVGSVAQICDANANTDACPAGYSCQMADSMDATVCCKNTLVRSAAEAQLPVAPHFPQQITGNNIQQTSQLGGSNWPPAPLPFNLHPGRADFRSRYPYLYESEGQIPLGTGPKRSLPQSVYPPSWWRHGDSSNPMGYNNPNLMHPNGFGPGASQSSLQYQSPEFTQIPLNQGPVYPVEECANQNRPELLRPEMIRNCLRTPDCSDGFECVKGMRSGRRVCCGIPQCPNDPFGKSEPQRCPTGGQDECPSGPQCPNKNLVVEVSPVSGQPIYCEEYKRTCGPGYQCLPTYGNRVYLCCGYVGQCPSGQSPYRDSAGYAMPCAGEHSHEQCPSGRCVFAVGHVGRMQYLCCVGRATHDEGYKCSNGGMPWINEITRQAKQCLGPGLGLPDECPSGYGCETNMYGNRMFCCKNGQSSPKLKCPNGYSTVVQDAGIPVACHPHRISEVCGRPNVCMQSLGGNGYICCEPDPSSQRVCANGQPPLAVSGFPVTCGGSDRRECAPGYTCEFVAGERACCGTGSIFGTCPDGSAATRLCSSASDYTSCRSAGRCTKVIEGGDDFGCCELGGREDVEPTMVAIPEPNSFIASSIAGVPGKCKHGGNLMRATACMPDSNDICPRGSKCLPTSNGIYGCCSRAGNRNIPPSSPGQCPNGNLPDLSNGQPRTCDPNNPFCRQGYECQKASNGGQYLCCRGPRCPGGVTIGSGVNGLPMRCDGGLNPCPDNQVCTPSSTSRSDMICCPMG